MRGSLQLADAETARFVTPYHPDLVAALRRLPARRWHGDDCRCGCPAPRRYWTVPLRDHAVVPALELANRFGLMIDPRIAAAVQGRPIDEPVTEAPLEALPADAEVHLDVAHLLRPYQRVGVSYIAARRRVLLGDEPGLGKSVQAVCAMRVLDARPVLVVCPATLKIEWARFFRRWAPEWWVTVLTSARDPITRVDVAIVNYDLLRAEQATPGRGPWHLVGLAQRLRDLLRPQGIVVDESHHVKNPRARRTNACQLLAEGIPTRLLMTGTPVMNRPDELPSQLKILGVLDQFGGARGYQREYCDAQILNGRYDTSGASNLRALHRRLREVCFIRRTKADVLSELPAKSRAQVTIEIDNRSEYQVAATNLREWLRVHANRPNASAERLAQIEYLKQISARGKMHGVVAWARDFLDGSDQKLVLFATHRAIVEALGQAFSVPVITGETPLAERQRIVDAFQRPDGPRVFVANMRAGGVGLTLTAASNVGLVEFAWTPAEHEQAEDRCHRFGQKDSVTAWHFVAADTIEQMILDVLAAKEKIVAQVVDGRAPDAASGSVVDEVARRFLAG